MPVLIVANHLLPRPFETGSKGTAEVLRRIRNFDIHIPLHPPIKKPYDEAGIQTPKFFCKDSQSQLTPTNSHKGNHRCEGTLTCGASQQ